MVKRQDADSLDSLINDSRFTHLACWSLGAVTPSLATAFRILPATAVPHVRTMAPGIRSDLLRNDVRNQQHFYWFHRVLSGTDPVETQWGLYLRGLEHVYFYNCLCLLYYAYPDMPGF